MDIKLYTENVKIITEKWSFYQLKEWKDKGKLIFGNEPSSKVWSQGRRARWIESILMSIPLAPIFTNMDYQGRLVIFDGFNRLSSVFAFIDNEYSLKKIPILNKYNGMNYTALPPYLQSRINSASIQLCIIKPGTDEKVAASILQRVNIQSTAIDKRMIVESLNKINKK
jgi:hypothetical protein